MAKGKKGRVVKRSDAEELLDAAQAEADPKRAENITRNAMMLRIIADINKARGAHIGRPKGKTGPKIATEDAQALAFMQRKQKDTGEQRPYTLARLAVVAGKAAKRGAKSSQIKRLAAVWKQQNVPK